MAYDHHDEETLGKPYDARLVRRLLTYVRPYLKLVLLAVFILVFVAGFELALPFITRAAIDDYIVATARVVEVGARPGQFARDFVREHRADLIAVDPVAGDEGAVERFLLRSKTLSGYDPRQVARATDEGVVGEANYYIADGDAVQRAGVADPS